MQTASPSPLTFPVYIWLPKLPSSFLFGHQYVGLLEWTKEGRNASIHSIDNLPSSSVCPELGAEPWAKWSCFPHRTPISVEKYTYVICVKCYSKRHKESLIWGRDGQEYCILCDGQSSLSRKVCLNRDLKEVRVWALGPSGKRVSR